MKVGYVVFRDAILASPPINSTQKDFSDTGYRRNGSDRNNVKGFSQCALSRARIGQDNIRSCTTITTVATNVSEAV